jgi:hypothetical protein
MTAFCASERPIMGRLRFGTCSLPKRRNAEPINQLRDALWNEACVEEFKCRVSSNVFLFRALILPQRQPRSARKRCRSASNPKNENSRKLYDLRLFL